MKTAIIYQHGKKILSWQTAAIEVDEELRKEADKHAISLVARGMMETGYYRLVVRDGVKELDEEDLIA